MSMTRVSPMVVLLLSLTAGCGDDDAPGTGTDAGSGARDAGPGGSRDAGGTPPGTDAGTTLPGTDAGPPSGRDAGVRPDAGMLMPGELPFGDMGIAARHPGDVGIGSDTDVIFADDFESYGDASDLDANWNDGVYRNVRIATEAANVFAGSQALEFRNPRQDAELSNTVARVVSPELDVLFLRFYSRFDPAFDVTGSSHNGGGISAHYYTMGAASPGVPADGRNKFLVEYECWREMVSDPNPGNLNIYIYHPDQRTMWGDHFFPDGIVLPFTSTPGDFGPDFVSRANRVPELGRWYSYELMLQANTPGMRDGRVAMWLDGELIGDFGNLRLRDIDTLKISRFNLSLHIGSNTRSETRKWYDNVVAATSYIGPVYTP